MLECDSLDADEADARLRWNEGVFTGGDFDEVVGRSSGSKADVDGGSGVFN